MVTNHLSHLGPEATPSEELPIHDSFSDQWGMWFKAPYFYWNRHKASRPCSSLFLRRAINSVGRYVNTSAYSCRKHDIKAERSNQVFFQKSVILNVNFFRICRICFISGSISEYHTPLHGRRAVRHNAEKGTKRLTNGYKEGIIIMVFCACITYYLLAAFRFIISRF